MVRITTGLGRAAVVQARERIRGLSAGRLSIYGQLVAKEQAEKEVQPQFEAPESYHVLTVELSTSFRRLNVFIRLNNEPVSYAFYGTDEYFGPFIRDPSN